MASAIVSVLHLLALALGLPQASSSAADAPTYDGAAGVTPAPTKAELELLRTRVKDAVARTYPLFVTIAFAR